jgi:uncharacterized membrane protein YphA (DoxX/SURF4 family)
LGSKNANILFTILCWIIAAIFIYAGIGKMINPARFANDINNYRMMPYILVTITAIMLPWLEVLCGFFLIFGIWKKGAALILLLLSFIFLIAISSALLRGLDISCGCFAVSEEATRIGYTRLVEDIILFGMISFVYLKLLKSTH